MDKTAPGGVYLCQINENVSCGACCGLYNVPDLTREKLSLMLSERTEAFMKVPREIDAILEFGKNQLSAENKVRPFPEFHHCPYIGFIGKERMRPGCLLHPASDGNNGIDYSGLSYYGSMTCHIYFCPSYTMLPENYKRIIREAADDWYAYGLIITEIVLINAFFSEIESRLQGKIDETDIQTNQALIGIIKEFIGFKADWPFRSSADTAANYFFKDNLYERKPVDYSGINSDSPVSRYDLIFREFGSSFKSVEELRNAESMMDGLFNRARSLKI